MRFETISPTNYPEVALIYEEGIATGNATFQNKAYSWDEWDKAHLRHSRIVGIMDEQVIGWAALSPVSSRCVYEGVAEAGIYIRSTARGKGAGYSLLQKLIESSEQNGIWTIQSGIFQENIASLKLHGKCGFRTVGFREKIGQMHGAWRNTILLERRSQKVGAE